MRRSLIAVFTTWLLFIISIVPSYARSFDISGARESFGPPLQSRGLAAVVTPSDSNKSLGLINKCSNFLQKIFFVKPIKTFTKNFVLAPIKNVFRFIRKQTVKVRVAFFRRLAKKKGKSKYLNRKYAELLDKALQDKLLPIAKVQELIEEANSPELYRFFVGMDGHINLQIVDEVAFNKEVEKYIAKFGLDKNVKAVYLEALSRIHMNYRDLVVLHTALPGLRNNLDDAVKLRSYIKYADSLTKQKKKLALAQVKQLFAKSPDDKASYVAKFYKLQKRFEKFEKRELKKTLKKLIRKNKGEDSYALRSQAKKIAHEKREVYQNLLQNCRARGKTGERVYASGRFRKFGMSLTIASSVGGYVASNYEEPKNLDWFKNIGFDLAMSVILKHIGNNIQLSPHTSGMKKVFDSLKVGATTDLANSYLYSKVLFPISEDEMGAKLDELKQSPEMQKELDDLVKFLERDPEVKKFIDQLLKAKDDAGLEAALGPEDLDDPYLRENLIEALAVKTYEEGAGDWIRTGDSGTDRYVFHRGWAAYSAPKGFLLGLWTYNILCRGANTPRLAFAKAFSIYVVDKIINSYLYYNLRKRAVGM